MEMPIICIMMVLALYVCSALISGCKHTQGIWGYGSQWKRNRAYLCPRSLMSDMPRVRQGLQPFKSNNWNFMLNAGFSTRMIHNFCRVCPGSMSLKSRGLAEIWCHTDPWAPSQYPKRRLFVRSREVSRFVFRIVRSLWNLTGTSAALLPMCLSNFKAIRQFKVPFSWPRDLARSYEKTSFRILRRGPDILAVCSTNTVPGIQCANLAIWSS